MVKITDLTALAFCWGVLILSLPPPTGAYDDVKLTGGIAGMTQGTVANRYGAGQKDRTVISYSMDLRMNVDLWHGREFVAAVRAAEGEGVNRYLYDAETVSYVPFLPNYDAYKTSVIANANGGQPVTLAQAYVKGRYRSGRTRVWLGKLDVHALYDENRFAGDETRQFIAAPFVRMTGPVFHPVDGYYAPGLAVVTEPYRWLELRYVAAVGFQTVGSGHLQVVQANLKTDDRGLKGNYRVYALWDARLYHSLDGLYRKPEWGLGLSIDRDLARGAGIFFRYAWHPSGIAENSTLRALAFGISLKGIPWRRPDDTVGLGFGLATMADFTTTETGSSGPMVWEYYYRMQFRERVSVTWNAQYYDRIESPAAKSAFVFGVRLQVDF